MAWYGVHVIMAVRFKDGNQNQFPAWDNVHLIEANNSQEAETKAQESDKTTKATIRDISLERPSGHVGIFGIRKAVQISNAQSAENEPEDGAEVTYQTLEFDGEQALRSYASGETVSLKAIARLLLSPYQNWQRRSSQHDAARCKCCRYDRAV